MIHLITGGSGSGKSEYAENMLCHYQKEEGEQLIYIATMFPCGEETKRKIRRHQRMRRGKGFETIERYTNLAGIVDVLKNYESVSVLIECISNLTANELYMEEGAKESTAEEILTGIEAVCRIARNVVIVTNEVCSEGFFCSPEMIRYKQVMGEINCCLAKRADRVTEVVYGIAVEVKKDR